MSYVLALLAVVMQTGIGDRLSANRLEATAGGGQPLATTSDERAINAGEGAPEPVLSSEQCLKIAEEIAGHPLKLRRDPQAIRVGAYRNLWPTWLPPTPGRAYYRIEVDDAGDAVQFEIDAVDGSLISYMVDAGSASATTQTTLTEHAAESVARDWVERYWPRGASADVLRLTGTRMHDGVYACDYRVEAGTPPRLIGSGASVRVSGADGRVLNYATVRGPEVGALIAPQVTQDDAIASSVQALKLSGYAACYPELRQSGDILYYQIVLKVKPEHLPSGVRDPKGHAVAFVDATSGQVLEGSQIVQGKGIEVAREADQNMAPAPRGARAEVPSDVAVAPSGAPWNSVPWLAGGGTAVLFGAMLGVVLVRRRWRGGRG